MNPSVTRSFRYLACLFFIVCESSIAQDPPVEWGIIPKADLEMKSFPADPNASALILCDYGDTKFDNELDLVFTQYLRVKILTTKGYDWGTKSVVLTTEDGAERIRDIEGATYSLDDNGAVVTAILDKKDIFEEKADGKHTRYRFTLPGLKPGCVIEMRYTTVSKYMSDVPDWVFQSSEPVRWSEYRLTSPKQIVYTVVTNGFEPYAVNELKDVSLAFTGVASSYLGGTLQQGVMARWVLKNAPALREEPFTTTVQDYVNKIDVQLSRYTFAGEGTREVLRTWPSLLKELLDSRNFGNKIDVTRAVRKQTEAITASCRTPEEKMKAIYNWVSTSVVWTGQDRIFADQDVNDVLDTKKGSNAEMTFLLLSMLKSAGIEAAPVLLSTRSHGKSQEIYPILGQFNYVLSRATIGNQ
ncbi:MAG TPA: transglutaminase domain-containing protein, partial [Bacteroidota bacterium]